MVSITHIIDDGDKQSEDNVTIFGEVKVEKLSPVQIKVELMHISDPRRKIYIKNRYLPADLVLARNNSVSLFLCL